MDEIKYDGKVLGAIHFSRKGPILVAEGFNSLEKLLNLLPGETISVNGEDKDYYPFKDRVLRKVKAVYFSNEDYLSHEF